MKKTILLIAMACALAACNIEAPYITEAKGLTFEANNIMGTQMTVHCTPEDDRSYYYFSIMTQTEYKELDMTDGHFMTIMLDSLYRNYLDWRRDLLYNNEEYIMSFRNHSFHYGHASQFFTNLKPETDYVIYGFVINPEDIQLPIGKLYTQNVRTTKVINDVSPMVIDFRYDISPTIDTVFWSVDGEMHADPILEAIVSIRPSIDGKPTKDPYVISYISDDELNQTYGGDIGKYADQIVALIFSGNVDQSGLIHRDIKMYQTELDYGKGYTIMAAAYRTSYRDALYYLHIDAVPGASQSYSHELYKNEKKE